MNLKLNILHSLVSSLYHQLNSLLFRETRNKNYEVSHLMHARVQMKLHFVFLPHKINVKDSMIKFWVLYALRSVCEFNFGDDI